MAAKNTCTPQRIYGGYEQTLFLGCSILSYTATAGWGQQNSELTVELVEDPCSNPKIHYTNYVKETVTIPDPGFTEPNIGAPAFFKIADFEFAGLIQSYDQKEGANGFPVYSVKLIDPRVILSKVQLIVDNYEGDVGNMHNLINVYGFLESLDQNCDALVVDDMVFGAPAGGFGNSSRTDRGIPWSKVRGALNALIGNPQATINPKYSRGGVFFRGGGNGGYGEIDTGVAQAKYIVDITELPNAPEYYRIQGPVISLMDLISRVAEDAGCDYYIELLPTNNVLVIKLRVLVRKNQRALGTISSFVTENSIAGGGEGVVSAVVGRELRTEVNNSFLIGSKQRNFYEEDSASNITPYWGKDLDGNLIESNWDGVDWAVKLDCRRINLALNTPFPIDFNWIGESEIRHALGDYQTFINFVSQQTPNTRLKQYVVNELGFQGRAIQRRAAGNAAQIAAGANVVGPPDNAGDLAAAAERDMKTLYNWLNAYGGDFYGKQYLVKAPWVCYSTDTDSGKYIWTNLPSTEGGWSEAADVLGITNPSIVADFFKDEKGMWQPLLRYTTTNVNVEDLNIEDYMKAGSLWVRGSVSDKWIIGTPVVGYSDDKAAALVTLASPVCTKGLVPDAHAKMALLVRSGQADVVAGDIDGLNAAFGGRASTVGAVHKRAISPYAGGIPIVSNVATYGPWQAVGKSPGTVKAEVDEGLSPWEYGGAYWMNQAGITKVQQAVTEMQFAERGQITIPGYPEVSIGAALDSDPNRYLDRALSNGTAYGRPYNYVTIGTYDGGASISNINVTVSPQGVSTSYTINTFTPVFGRFYKGNADRIKQIGLNRLRGERDGRARASIKGMLMLSSARARARNQALGQINKGDDDAASPGLYIGGKLLSEDSKRKVCLVADSHTLPYYPDYGNTALMSIDGFFRPVSKNGSAGLPQTNDNDNVCTDMPNQTQGPPPPMVGDGSPGGDPSIKITQVYLDYLADATSATTFFADDRVDGVDPSGHDIEMVAKLGSISALEASHPSGAASIIMHPLGVDGGSDGLYASDYRHMALRGPLMIHGWGYDILGKPIPNENEDSVGDFHNDYDGLSDKFAENWLSDAKTWPVAPVDLRFDRKRGVWTTPPAFRMYQVEADEDIDAGSPGPCTILNPGSDIVEPDGDPIADPKITVQNFYDFAISGADKFVAYYDTEACEYWPLISTGAGGGGGGGGCEAGISTTFYVATKVCCAGDTLTIDYSQLEFSNGCLVGKVDGGGPSCP